MYAHYPSTGPIHYLNVKNASTQSQDHWQKDASVITRQMYAKKQRDINR